jgi:hypothetical protein
VVYSSRAGAIADFLEVDSSRAAGGPEGGKSGEKEAGSFPRAAQFCAPSSLAQSGFKSVSTRLFGSR